jgi:hypothetical protein
MGFCKPFGNDLRVGVSAIATWSAVNAIFTRFTGLAGVALGATDEIGVLGYQKIDNGLRGGVSAIATVLAGSAGCQLNGVNLLFEGDDVLDDRLDGLQELLLDHAAAFIDFVFAA